MNERILFDAIGAVDASCLQICDTYTPSGRRGKSAKRAAVVAAVILSAMCIACLTVPEVRAFFAGYTQEKTDYNYIQLPPELTTWSETTSEGGSVGPAGILRGDTFYLLTQEEYHQLIDDGADPDEVLAAREQWAQEWKDYTPPSVEVPPQSGTIVMD